MLNVETGVGPGWGDEQEWIDLARRAVRAALGVSPFANLIDKQVDVEVAVVVIVIVVTNVTSK